MSIQYFEVVTPNVDAACSTWSSVHDLSFGEPEPALGQARVATMSDGSWVGIRAPLAEHETPTARAYHSVPDIHAAAQAAQELGAMIAYPPTAQGEFGTFAIYILDDVQYGLWQA